MRGRHDQDRLLARRPASVLFDAGRHHTASEVQHFPRLGEDLTVGADQLCRVEADPIPGWPQNRLPMRSEPCAGPADRHLGVERTEEPGEQGAVTGLPSV